MSLPALEDREVRHGTPVDEGSGGVFFSPIDGLHIFQWERLDFRRFFWVFLWILLKYVYVYVYEL